MASISRPCRRVSTLDLINSVTPLNPFLLVGQRPLTLLFDPSPATITLSLVHNPIRITSKRKVYVYLLAPIGAINPSVTNAVQPFHSLFIGR
jgi:hypothetical protein